MLKRSYVWKAISVAKLRELLAALQSTDELSTNEVDNLTVWRDGVPIGGIDIASEELFSSGMWTPMRSAETTPSSE